MKHLLHIILISLLVISCRKEPKSAIIFNANNDYLESQLMLKDVADIQYIPLRTNNDTILIKGFTSQSRDIVLANNRIFIDDYNKRILIFDLQGNLQKTIQHFGRGPGEFLGISNFIVDSTKKEIIIHDVGLRKFISYNYSGKQNYEFITEKIGYINSIGVLNDSTLNLYNSISLIGPIIKFLNINGKGVRFTSLPFDYKKPYIHDPLGVLSYSNMISAKDGCFLFNFRSDTLYKLTPHKKIIPQFIDQTPYTGEDMQFYPTIETNRYVFFSTLFSHITNPNGKLKYFVYDKREKQFFRLKQNSSEKKDISFINNYNLALIKGYLEMNSLTLSQNYNIAATLLPAYFLIDNISSLPDSLKKIAQNMKENDNPVLMIIKFKN